MEFYIKDLEYHESDLKRIQAEVRDLSQRKQAFRIFHGSTNSTRPAHHERVVDISCLRRILRIDPKKGDSPGRTQRPHGHAGSAGESSSFKYGYFSQTVSRVEMILADGVIVRASAHEREDLFHGAAEAAGTLGVITLLELRLIPAKTYVKLTYYPISSMGDAVDSIMGETKNSMNDYVDGILYSRNSGVIMAGILTNEKPPSVSVQRFSGPWDPWFYMHAQERIQNRLEETGGEAMVDYIPLRDYLFRYDRGAFWVGRECFKYFGFVPFNRLTRWFLDDFLHARMLYRALHGTSSSVDFMIQDLSLPFANAERFMDYAAGNFEVWPLWLCPLREMRSPAFHPNSSTREDKPQPMLNIGLWGRVSKGPIAFVQQNRDLERHLSQLGGRKALNSHTYYTEQEFWDLYGKPWYEKLREKYRATTLPSIYDKVTVNPSEIYAERAWSQWLLSL
ncbi:uncharacterized protein PG998_012929 [Apiospora kogelbergensis]|uniref:uncharacterized protein n=1 Tax=Apiospora kogelbergensis TaxID=1337665 RepID=UPI0031319675